MYCPPNLEAWAFKGFVKHDYGALSASVATRHHRVFEAEQHTRIDRRGIGNWQRRGNQFRQKWQRDIRHGHTERTAELCNTLAGQHSLVVVEHDMEFLRRYADFVTVMHSGSVLAEGSVAEVGRFAQELLVHSGTHQLADFAFHAKVAQLWTAAHRSDSAAQLAATLHALPPAVKARVAVEQASTFGWAKYVGANGRSIGMRSFGASAPLKDLTTGEQRDSVTLEEAISAVSG